MLPFRRQLYFRRFHHLLLFFKKMAHKSGPPPPLCSILGSQERKREFKNFQQLFCRKSAVKLKKIGKAIIGTRKSGKEGKKRGRDSREVKSVRMIIKMSNFAGDFVVHRLPIRRTAHPSNTHKVIITQIMCNSKVTRATTFSGPTLFFLPSLAPFVVVVVLWCALYNRITFVVMITSPVCVCFRVHLCPKQ